MLRRINSKELELRCRVEGGVMICVMERGRRICLVSWRVHVREGSMSCLVC